MAAVLKDKRIQLWTEGNGEEYDDEGHLVPSEPVLKGTFWAHYRHESSREYIAAAAVDYTEDAIFIVNYNTVFKEIDVAHDYIVYNNTRFDINGIDDYKGGKKDIRLSCKAHLR